LPPGLYEAVLTPKDKGSELVAGDYLVRFEPRTLNDIRRLGGNDEEDDRKFATAARISEINLGVYRTFFQPWVRMWTSEALAETWRELHPLRLQYEIFSRTNPLIRQMSKLAVDVRENRHVVPRENPLLQAQEWFSDCIEAYLNGYRDLRDQTSEVLFDVIYGAPFVQALTGLKASDGSARHRPGKDANYYALVGQRVEELRNGMTEGGPREAVIRALLYIRMPEGVVDERGFNLMRELREEAGSGQSLEAFKELVREQFFMLMIDERRAVDAIPGMLARDPALASRMTSKLRGVIEAVGIQGTEAKARFAEMKAAIEATRQRGAAKVADRKHVRSGTARSARPHSARSARPT
jgi:hypothetical protein